MRRLHHIALALALVCTAAVLGSSREPLVAAPAIDDPLREALSGIDFVAGKNIFDDLLGPDAATDLIEIARDVDAEVDPGLRIRAYRALALYAAEPATRVALLEAIDEHASPLQTAGVEIVYAKAAMDALAEVTRSGTAGEKALAAARLGQVLEHPIADIRAAAARALGKTEAPEAAPLLRTRLEVETTLLVRVSIQRALDALEGL